MQFLHTLTTHVSLIFFVERPSSGRSDIVWVSVTTTSIQSIRHIIIDWTSYLVV